MIDCDQMLHGPPLRPLASDITEESSPFDATHTYLRQTLQEIETTTPPTVPEFPAYTPQQPMSSLRLERVKQCEELGNTPDPSMEMLVLALGRNEDLVAATMRHSADPSTPACTATQRVGNHTFNFDFGALASNVENQSNTYMSWF